MGLMSWLRARLSSDPAIDDDDPKPEHLLHYSHDGRAALCGFMDGVYRWTVEPEAVTCPTCKPKVQMLMLHQKVTMR